MCDDGITHDQYERMRTAYVTLHAAAAQVLALEGKAGAADAAVVLRKALIPDPACFALAAAPPTYRILLKPSHPVVQA